jgi:hypothetical protein
MFQELHHYHVIQAHYAMHLKWSRADPNPVGYVSSYSFGENYTRSMSEQPTIQKPLPVYASKPDGLTTREWESDTRTQELIAHIRRLEVLLDSKQQG